MNNEILQQAYDMLIVLMHGKKNLLHSQVLIEAKKILGIFSIEDPEEAKKIIDNITSRYEENNSVKAFAPDILTDGQYDPNSWIYSKRDEVKHEYFTRYRAYLRRDGFEEDIIDKIEINSQKILSYCPDPKIALESKLSERHKKGLVVGDVQSGKTANYLGLINVACDYDYKIIVLLAGATNSLRMQTQGRIDVGMIGAQSETIGSANINFIGVGEDARKYFAIPLTNSQKDFVKNTRLTNNSSAEDYNKPIVFVVKKNTSVLKAMKEWLKPGLNDIMANSILIIDDESDYASVNTNKPENDPTKINGLIRDVYNNFPIASYIGFTATPFANVFINPYDDACYQDLFPSNFIIQLKSPSNYFGYEKVFPMVESERKHLVILDENEDNFLPVLHKKDSEFSELSRSLKDAILGYLISNVIRTKRGHGNKHRSMMINISWLNAVQSRIRDAVTEYVEQIKRVIAQDSLKPMDKFLRNVEMARMFEIYTQDKFYEQLIQEVPFEEVKNGLNDETKLIEIAIINSKVKQEERFDYESRKDRGARAILIGGFVLSRGLTLEGLMTSYYSRSASSYDTLLQMCRWFGYRPKYEDLCRIFIIDSAVHEFEAVIEAVDNLKEQFHRMAIAGKTPMEFGLMIKEFPESLEIRALHPSARNKMRNTVVVERRMNFGGVYTDTSKLYKNPKINIKNKEAINSFIREIGNHGLSIGNIGRKLIQCVPASLIAELLSRIIVPLQNIKFSGESISEYIKLKAPDEHWDVLIASGSSTKQFCFNKETINAIQRGFVARRQEDIIRVSGGNNRLSEPSMFSAGLSDGQIERAREHARDRYQGKQPLNDNPEPVAIDFLSLKERPPLLILFPIDLKTEVKDRLDDSSIKMQEDIEKIAIKESFEEELLWGFGVGFPSKETGIPIIYRLNLIKRDEQIVEFETNEEDEEDD